jgi:hypothetical protein
MRRFCHLRNGGNAVLEGLVQDVVLECNVHGVLLRMCRQAGTAAGVGLRTSWAAWSSALPR